MTAKSTAGPTVYFNGRIYTVDQHKPWVEAILIVDGKFEAVGTAEEVFAVAGSARRVDLQGRMVMPGLHDAHTHLLFSGLKFRSECRLTLNAGPETIVEELCACEKCLAGRLSGWIVGGEFNPNVFKPGTVDRRFLDAAFPDTPVYLFDYSIHHALVNSKALELAGVDDTTPDPKGGKFIRREGSSELTGELVERATWPVKRVMPRYPDDTYRDAMTWAIATNHQYGITSVQEASASLIELEILNALDNADELTLHVAAHLVWQEESFGGASSSDLDHLIAARRQYQSRHVRTNFAKCWLDGAPLPPHFTEARLDEAGREADHTKIHIPEDELTAKLIEFDKDGITLKIHCAGEGSVRVALNAIEAMRQANGPDGPRHEIAHSAFFHPTDRERWARNNVVAEMSPAIWHRKEPEFAALDAGFKFATLHETGALLTVGSDWIITPDPNLFPALQGMLERGSESIGLATALKMMTLDGATAVGMDNRIGSIAPSKSADFIVLDRNLFEIPISDVGDTIVLTTVFEGQVVHQK